MKRTTGIAVGLVLSIGLVLAGVAVGSAQDSPESLISARCARCHNLGPVCGNLGRKTAEQWTETVGRMVKKGAQANDQEKTLIIDYLSGPEAPGGSLCK